MAALYVVSTPIGNLGDMTYRAVDVLRSVKRVMAEDTRRTSILLRRYEVSVPMVSAHAHNEQARVAQLIAWLDAGEDVALVSDAGTPLLSDPGSRLVRAVIEAGHTVVPIPGASALLAALVASGLEPSPFTFYGFPPRSGRLRSRLLEEAAASPHLSVFYEAPGRLVRLLADLAQAGDGERAVVVARELTKLHESFFRGTLSEALAYYGDTVVRGEVVVLLAGAAGRSPADGEDAAKLIRTLLEAGEKPSAAARAAVRQLGIPRPEAYRLALEQARSGED